MGRERPRDRHAAQKRDNIAPFHSITSSARSRNASGIVNPSALAVVRLMTRSNLVGCSTGKAAPDLMLFEGAAPRAVDRSRASGRRADQQVVCSIRRDAYGSWCGGRLWKPGARKNVWLRLAFAVLSALMVPATTSLRFTRGPMGRAPLVATRNIARRRCRRATAFSTNGGSIRFDGHSPGAWRLFECHCGRS
jgi:hypothetical protein